MKEWNSDSQLAFWTGNKRGVGQNACVQWLLMILITSLCMLIYDTW